MQQFLLGLLLGTMFLANLMAGGGGRKRRRRRKRDVVQGEDMAFTKIIKGIRLQSAWEKIFEKKLSRISYRFGGVGGQMGMI